MTCISDVTRARHWGWGGKLLPQERLTVTLPKSPCDSPRWLLTRSSVKGN